MIFTEVKDEDFTSKKRFKCQVDFENFMALGVKVAMITDNEERFKDESTMAWTYSASARRFAYPIKVIIREKKVYFVRTDMK